MENVVNRALAAKKKALFFLFAALVLCGCRGPQGPQGPQGPAGEGMNWKIVDIDVPANKWNYTNYADNNFFYSEWDVKSLSSFVYTDGNVQAYIYLKDGDYEVQHALPYVRHVEEVDKDGNAYFYTRTIDCVFGVGYVRFEVRDSDFEYEVDTTINPEAMSFRVVMTW